MTPKLLLEKLVMPLKKMYKQYTLRFAFLAFLLPLTFTAVAEINIPIKKLKEITAIPDVGPLLLEGGSRSRLYCPNKERPRNDACPSGEGTWQYDLVILEVETGLELSWNAPGIENMPPVPKHFDCGAGGQMLAWAAKAEKFLVAQCGSAYLFKKDGTKEILQLQMLGNFDPYVGMSQYSLSSDAKYISYTLYAREPRSDKLYWNLMVQETTGSAPVTIAAGYTDYVSALSPDGSFVAYSVGGNVKIAKLTGEVVFDIQSPNAMFGPAFNRIQELRWSPDGSKLAARISDSIYLLNISETTFTAAVRDKSITRVASMAWSPNGEELAFRSTYEGEETCSYGPQFSGGAIVFHTCADGYRLYSVSVATGKTRRLNASTEYRPGALLWIQ